MGGMAIPLSGLLASPEEIILVTDPQAAC